MKWREVKLKGTIIIKRCSIEAVSTGAYMENGNLMLDEPIKNELISRFLAFGKELGFTTSVIQDKTWITSVFLIQANAIELQIDWFENALFVYIVRLIDKQLPNPNTVYSYEDGSWCRKIVQDVYSINHNKKYSKQFCNKYTRDSLFEQLNYYIDLIKSDPTPMLAKTV